VRTRGPGARWRGRRVGVCPERDPSSDAGSTGSVRLKLTGKPRVSVAAASGGCAGRLRRPSWVGRAGGLRCWAGKGGGESLLFFSFQTPISFLNKQPFEFKVRFESKHPKTMHLHECNRELLYFIN
jgi:hypothetical protein